MAGRLRKIERRALDSKQRLRSPANAPVVFSVGGVSWYRGSGVGEWGSWPGLNRDAEVNVALLGPL